MHRHRELAVAAFAGFWTAAVEQRKALCVLAWRPHFVGGLVAVACYLPQLLIAQTNYDSTLASAPRYAIVVGVSSYPPESGLRSLHWTTQDALKLADALSDLGFAVQRPLLDYRATRTGIHASINAVAAAMDPAAKRSATIVMYFSGHGFGEKIGEGGQQRNYLATYETDGHDLKESGLSVDNLSQWLHATGVGRILLILDACRNSPSGGKAVDSPTWGRFESSEGVRILLSTRVGDYSWEDDGLQHGVFSNYLIAGLKGAAKDGNGAITASSVFDYVNREVRGWAFNNRVTQAPFQAGEWSGDFLLASSTMVPKSVIVTPGNVPASPRPPPAPTVVQRRVEQLSTRKLLRGVFWNNGSAGVIQGKLRDMVEHDLAEKCASFDGVLGETRFDAECESGDKDDCDYDGSGFATHLTCHCGARASCTIVPKQ